MSTNNMTNEMRQSDTLAEELIRLAHAVLSETRSLMLPHHFNVIGARRVIFDEIVLLKKNVVGIDKGLFRTNIIMITQPGQRISVTKEQSLQDTVILDLTSVSPTFDAMRHFLLETEDDRRWHHAPKIVINRIKSYKR